MNCEVMRDLLPLYADDVCSTKSRELVEEHLKECPACTEYLKQLKENEIVTDLIDEKGMVIRYGEQRMKRRSAMVGSVVAGLFMIPVLVCLIVNLSSGRTLGWFFVVLASLAVAASLIVTPLMVPEDKAFWTFCAFTCSIVVLLAVTCLYSHGSWFFIASSALLFGLAVVFLPFVVKARLVRKIIGESNRALIVLALDAALFVNMMNMISFRGKITFTNVVYTIGVIAGIGLVVSEIMRKRGISK